VDWIYEVPIRDRKKEQDDYLTGKAVFDLYKEEKSQLKELEEKKVAGSVFTGEEDDLTNVRIHSFVEVYG